MRIAYDFRRIANPGIGRYMKSLVKTMVQLAPEHDYIVIMAPGTHHLLEADASVQRILARSKYYSISEQLEIPSLLRKHKVDILHAPHFVVPANKTCTTVVTIHDAIHLAYPQDIASRAGRLYASWMMKLATTVADRVITVSEHSKMDLVRFLGTDPKKITVIAAFLPEGLVKISDRHAIAAIRGRYGINRDYILYNGIYKERKNHAGLVRAFAELTRHGLDLDLVISGPIAEGEAKLTKLGRELGIADRLVFPGFVPDLDMPGLYSGAAVYACPSLYEGFGLTPLEAMACGVPVVCHNGTSLPEVCGNAALFSDARQPEIFADALRRAIEDSALRAQLMQLGYENVRRFSHARSAGATLNLYLELQGSASPRNGHKINRVIGNGSVRSA
jgi:glycosyltransferase involved in cell wall biosynthesis